MKNGYTPLPKCHILFIYLEEHFKLAMDEVKLRQFLAQTKVWEYAKITEEDYNG